MMLQLLQMMKMMMMMTMMVKLNVDLLVVIFLIYLEALNVFQVSFVKRVDVLLEQNSRIFPRIHSPLIHRCFY